MRLRGTLTDRFWAARLRRVLNGLSGFSFQIKPSVSGNKKAVDRKSTSCSVFDSSNAMSLVPRRGLEPPRCYSLVPETSASTNSAIWASQEASDYRSFMLLLLPRRFGCEIFLAPMGERDNKKADDLRSSAFLGFCLFKMVPRRGLEPPRCYSLVPETSASTNSAIWASQESKDCILKK